MNENICYFVPYENNNESIKTVNLVYQANQPKSFEMKIDSLMKIYYVTSGTGVLHTRAKQTDLNKGDIFFTFPAERFCIQAKNDFTFMYISFIGVKGNKIMEQIGIDKNNFHFKNCSQLDYIWTSSKDIDNSISAITSEGILLYSFSYIGRRNVANKNVNDYGDNLSYYIKKYVDEHISDSNLSLEKIGDALVYNPKYISIVFKKKMKMNLFDYINILRIQNACTMMDQGITSVKDISYSCGFNDSQYFSKVFRLKVGCSPKEYIKNIRLE